MSKPLPKEYKELVRRVASWMTKHLDIPVIGKDLEKVVYTKIILFLTRCLVRKMKKKKRR
jgi:hypothetical protein